MQQKPFIGRAPPVPAVEDHRASPDPLAELVEGPEGVGKKDGKGNSKERTRKGEDRRKGREGKGRQWRERQTCSLRPLMCNPGSAVQH